MRRIAILLLLCAGCQSVQPQLEADLSVKRDDRGKPTPHVTFRVSFPQT